MDVRIEDSAQIDLIEGYHFYEKGEDDAGRYFLDKVREEILELQVSGGVHRKRYGFHFCPSSCFPHGFYYRVAGETVKIYAVLDCRRSPRTIRKILRTR
jgi:hypothetical protein